MSRTIDTNNAPDGEIFCQCPDGSIYRLVEPDYWQLMQVVADQDHGLESAFGEFKQTGNCSIKTGGITVRDYFAAKALSGMLDDCRWGTLEDSAEMAAKVAYKLADAMLKERAQ